MHKDTGHLDNYKLKAAYLDEQFKRAKTDEERAEIEGKQKRYAKLIEEIETENSED